MTALRANTILRQLESREQQTQIATLSALDAAHRDEVRRLLGQVKPTARIDLPALISSVRREVAARAELEAASRPSADAIRYELELRIQAASRGELEDLRDDLVDARDRGEDDASPVLAEFISRIAAIRSRLREAGELEEPDDDLDDNEEPPKRRSIPRVASRRALDLDSFESRADPAPTAAKRVGDAPAAAARPFYAGPRLLGGAADPTRPFGASVDYSPSYEPMSPPWLLPDEDETDEEILDDDIIDEARAVEAR